jgi:hypothetical protein
VLADWAPSDVATLADLLARFNTMIEQTQGRPWPRPGEQVTGRR